MTKKMNYALNAGMPIQPKWTNIIVGIVGDTMALMIKCPQCGESIISPDIGGANCATCGWKSGDEPSIEGVRTKLIKCVLNIDAYQADLNRAKDEVVEYERLLEDEQDKLTDLIGDYYKAMDNEWEQRNRP